MPRWTPGLIALIVILIGLSYNFATATRVETWISEDGGSSYTDTYSKWRGTFLHRSVTATDSEDNLISICSGPMSASGKPHGEWKMSIFQPEYATRQQFYWYGDQISEGDWHLQSK